MENIKALKEKVQITENKYYDEYEQEDTMPNDLLDYAEDVMDAQYRLIGALENGLDVAQKAIEIYKRSQQELLDMMYDVAYCKWDVKDIKALLKDYGMDNEE